MVLFKRFLSLSIKDIYYSNINSNLIKYDVNQERIVQTMEKVQQAYHRAYNSHNNNSHSNDSNNQQQLQQQLIPKGLYVWGGVGTGKTMLMDLFFTTTNTSRKRRVHFHKFMLEVHCHIHSFKRHLLNTYGRDTNINLSPDRDPIKYAAKIINSESQLLCFDEFQVTDIADAIIMTKLFNELWNNGTVLIATSNRPPQDLYLGGLNRQYFLPFIEELKHRCIVKHLNSNIDYRFQQEHKGNVYFTPLSETSTQKLRQLFELDKDSSSVIIKDISVMMGRKLTLEVCGNSCWVTFQQLCCANLGSSDYTALISNFDRIYLDGIPYLSILEHDIARRFITLIDIIYDAGKILFWTSETEPNQIFQSIKPNRLSEVDFSLQNSFGTDHFWLTDERMGRNKEELMINRLNESSSSSSSSSLLTTASPGEEKVCQKPPFDSLSITEHFTLSNSQNNQEEEVELKLLEGQLASVQELSFAFKRAASRLNEMASISYEKNRRNLDDFENELNK